MKLLKKLWEKTNEKIVVKRIPKKSEGFTFVETLAVLAIGAVMAAGSSVAVSKYIKIAKETTARNQIEQYKAALQSYFLDCGRFPTTEQGISALWEKPVLYPVPENWAGPYLERKPSADPWGTDFKYLSSESSVMPSEVPENMPFILISYGADKIQGGEGNGEDICSWK
ncbi:MAG: type II secretion system major pseudopilin GspG [Treponema sp.]|nr:type II secretion system major pseudopilin GspG [Treponema sp.]